MVGVLRDVGLAKTRVVIVFMINKPLGRQCTETTFVLLDVTKL